MRHTSTPQHITQPQLLDALSAVNNSHLCKILEMLEEHERILDGGKLNTNDAGQI